MKALLKRLQHKARESCEWRGHTMSRWMSLGWLGNVAAGRQVRIAHCKICKREVVVDTHPAPNGIDIGGEAVALGCGDKSGEIRGIA